MGMLHKTGRGVRALCLTAAILLQEVAHAGCTPELLADAARTQPDVVVVLGAGFDPRSGLPARHAHERAKVLKDVLSHVNARPEILFSGGVKASRRTTPPSLAEIECYQLRRAQEGLSSEGLVPRAHDLTEADVLCGLSDLQSQSLHWSARFWFEARSASTLENARRSAQVLGRSAILRTARRVLVVTSQVMSRAQGGRVRDDHAMRSYRLFRRFLPRDHSVAVLGCTPHGEPGSRLILE